LEGLFIGSLTLPGYQLIRQRSYYNRGCGHLLARFTKCWTIRSSGHGFPAPRRLYHSIGVH